MAKKIWEKILKALKSRTTWTIVILFIINGIEGVREFIPSFWLPFTNGILSILGIYFRVNPRS